MAVLSGPSLLFAPVLDLGNGSYKVICVCIPMPAPESVHTREQMHSTSAVTGVHAVCTWTDDCAVTRLLRSGAYLSHCPYHARVDAVGTRPPAQCAILSAEDAAANGPDTDDGDKEESGGPTCSSAQRRAWPCMLTCACMCAYGHTHSHL